MVSNEDIYFDSSSGISIDDQREILRQINGIAEKQRRSLLDTSSLHNEKKTVTKAKKKSALFPVVVNAAALLILITGGLTLFLLNQRKETQIREGRGNVAMTEQALIGELTAAQQEAFLTMERLAKEQERATGIDSYLSGAIAVVSELILNNEFDLAGESIGELRRFLNTPSFESNRTFLSRKEFYIQSINSLEKLIDDIRRSGFNYVMALEAKNTELETNAVNLNNTIETLTARNTQQTNRVVQLEDTVSEKDRNISSLTTERNNLTQTVSDLQTVNSQQEAQIMQLNDQLTNIRQTLQALSQ